MVELPLPAVIGEVAATEDWEADTAPTEMLKPLLVTLVRLVLEATRV